jgi:hypothetical protein
MKINLPDQRDKVIHIKVKVKRAELHTRSILSQHQNFNFTVRLEVNDLKLDKQEPE